MNLIKALRLPTDPSIAFIGAGGKSTAMFQLARQFTGPTIVTASTHLGVWQIALADKHIITASPGQIEDLEENLDDVLLITGGISEDRTQPLDNSTLHWLNAFCQERSLPLLVEADGSRQRPLKAPADHEPPIPDFIQHVVQVAGLTGLGRPLDENHVHRNQIFGQLSGLRPGKPVTPGALKNMLVHPQGGLKNIPDKARRMALLNQADSPNLSAQAKSLAKRLLPAYDAVVIASLNHEKVHAVHEPVAGIILAAGESVRFGQPKQLLDWRGEPFVRAVAITALEAGLSPVLVVTGAYSKQVAAAIVDLPARVVKNRKWKSGQAGSIQAGLRSLGDLAGAAIFMLADQPQLTPSILGALVETHASNLDMIIAPLIMDQRGNPVLMDRSTFPDLMNLEGEVGGRGIFSKHRVTYLPWHDDALLLDVDTPEQYQRLKDTLE